ARLPRWPSPPLLIRLSLRLRRLNIGPLGWRRALMRTLLLAIRTDIHMSAENCAFIDDQFRRSKISFVTRAGFEFDAVIGGQITLNLAFNNDRPGFHISRHLRFFGHMQPA